VVNISSRLIGDIAFQPLLAKRKGGSMQYGAWALEILCLEIYVLVEDAQFP
jgi:hypothetical protein